MKRSFVKPAKKNPKFWEIDVNGSSYTVTEGQTGLSSEATTKDFANEGKCLAAAVKLIEKTREKGFKETLPEYSEWPGERQDYAIWRNVAAIEFILKTLKENATYNTAKFREPEAVAKLAEESPDRMSAMASELEIYMTSDGIKIRKMAEGKDFFGIEFTQRATMFKAWYDYWAQGCDAITLSMKDEASSKAIIDYFVDNGKGKWFGAEVKEKSAEKRGEQDAERREKYLAKLKTVVNKEFKQVPFSALSIKLSHEFDTNKTIYASLDDIRKDIVPVIFNCVKPVLKQNREEALCKTYHMLLDVGKQLPLVRLRQAFDDVAAGKTPIEEELYKDMVFEKWENPASLSALSIASVDDKAGIVEAAAAIAENADAYILRTRFLGEYIRVANKADGKVLDETSFFALTARYPETEESLATFIGKLAACGKEYPTVFNYPGSASNTPVPVGATAAAALAIFGGKRHDGLIASFLDTIKGLGWYRVSCSTMRNLWKEYDVTPDVPQAIAVMWES